jgi:hypothetical protein
MKLTLHYRGPLRANGSPAHKHALREHFHLQLSSLWSQLPLRELRQFFLVRNPDLEMNSCVLQQLGPFEFAPLVSARLRMVTKLDITLLRPEPPGNLITQGGDIDNRLKTLFDALTVPRHANALPNGAAPSPGQNPFFCLLEDDNLITAVSVGTEQLLEPGVDASTVELTVRVSTSVTHGAVEY